MSLVKNKDLLQQLSAALLSSTRGEPSNSARRLEQFEGLARMDELASLILASLPAVPTPKVTVPEEQKPALPPSIRYETSRLNYRPALADPSVQQALAALHESRLPKRTAVSTPAPPLEIPTDIEQAIENNPFADSFSASNSPRVQASPKEQPLIPGQGRRHPNILRPDHP